MQRDEINVKLAEIEAKFNQLKAERDQAYSVASEELNRLQGEYRALDALAPADEAEVTDGESAPVETTDATPEA